MLHSMHKLEQSLQTRSEETRTSKRSDEGLKARTGLLNRGTCVGRLCGSRNMLYVLDRDIQGDNKTMRLTEGRTDRVTLA